MGNILNKAGLEHLAEILDEKYGNPPIPQALVKTTYAELKALRDGGKLVAGTWYRITDYECTTSQENTRSAGHRFDVIVLALDNKTLSEEARACVNEEYEQSMMFVDDGDHCVNTGEVFTVTDVNGRIEKAIFFRFFDYSDAAGYFITGDVRDWKERTADGIWINVQDGNVIDTENKVAVSNTDEFTTEVWGSIVSTSFGYFSYCKLEAWKILYCLDNDETRFAWADASGKGVIYRMIDEWNNDVPYDFKNIQFVRLINEDGEYDEDDGEDTWVFTFAGRSYYIDDDEYSDWKDGSLESPYGHMSDEYTNTFVNNVIKPYIYLYDAEDEDRTKCGKARLNDIVMFGYWEEIGSTEDEHAYYPAHCCYSNTFGDNCYSNTFGDNCNSNTLGNNCYSNTFGNNCYSNKFGNNCYSNTFGGNCYFNKFGTSSSTKNYMQYVTLENGVLHTYINCTATTSPTNYGQNIHVNSGVAGTSSTNRKTLTISTAGNKFLTTFCTSSDVKVNV